MHFTEASRNSFLRLQHALKFVIKNSHEIMCQHSVVYRDFRYKLKTSPNTIQHISIQTKDTTFLNMKIDLNVTRKSRFIKSCWQKFHSKSMFRLEILQNRYFIQLVDKSSNTFLKFVIFCDRRHSP